LQNEYHKRKYNLKGSVKKTTSIFFGHAKTFLVSVGISWPFLFGIVTGTAQFGLKISGIERPLTYISISVISVVIGIVAVLIERKREGEKIFETFRTFSDYVKACKEIHQTYSRVMVLAKTPGLILPTERYLDQNRKDYFDYIYQKLAKESSYQLDYVFDIEGYKSVLSEYIIKNDDGKINQSKEMLKNVLKYKNLDLRYIETDTLASIIIGSNTIACIGFREKDTKKVAEGVRIHAEELVIVLKSQYDLLFNKATKVDEDFFEETLAAVKKGKDL